MKVMCALPAVLYGKELWTRTCPVLTGQMLLSRHPSLRPPVKVVEARHGRTREYILWGHTSIPLRRDAVYWVDPAPEELSVEYKNMLNA